MAALDPYTLRNASLADEAQVPNSPRHVRDQLQKGDWDPRAFRAALDSVAPRDRDAWWDELLFGPGGSADSILDDSAELPRGCTPYLPCPVDTILEAIDAARLGPDDVFIDIGSGTGRATALAHFLTGAAAIGLEIQKHLVDEAQRVAARWNRPRLVTLYGDAARLVRFVPVGTVYFLYCPCGGERLERVFSGLEDLARARKIRICCVDMPPLTHSWLRPLNSQHHSVHTYESQARHS